jgi:hypothetical protein
MLTTGTLCNGIDPCVRHAQNKDFDAATDLGSSEAEYIAVAPQSAYGFDLDEPCPTTHPIDSGTDPHSIQTQASLEFIFV